MTYIGQGKVLVSPLDMASVAATAKAGVFHVPPTYPTFSSSAPAVAAASAGWPSARSATPLQYSMCPMAVIRPRTRPAPS
ncbi:hypothetical protein ACFY1B_44540 [Streptomyces mirabilis]|uniref:hypothetical protein n=1 Tax=Streptomyces mirabilis TaxID=68239 RepID=UPI00367FA2E2